MFAPICGQVDPDGPKACRVRLSADSADLIVQYIAAIAALGTDYTLETSPEIIDRVRLVGHQLINAGNPSRS